MDTTIPSIQSANQSRANFRWFSTFQTKPRIGILVAASFFIIIIAAVVTALYFSTSSESDNEVVMENAGRMQQLKNVENVLMKMDLSIDPCEDFYAFACRGWQKSNPIPNTTLSWSITDAMDRKTLDYIGNVMKEPIRKGDIQSWKNAIAVYNLCTEGNEDDRQHAKFCVNMVLHLYPITVGHMYVKHLYGTGDKYSKLIKQANEMFVEIKETFKRLSKPMSIQNSNNTDAAKQNGTFTFQDIDDLSACIGFPDWILNVTKVQIEEGRTKQTDFGWRRGETICHNMENSDQSCTDCLWWELPENDIAACDQAEFKIYFKSHYVDNTLAELGPYKALHYGSLGFMLGHEIGHAFFERGLKEFQNGSLTPASKCLVNQYNSFTVPIFENGTLHSALTYGNRTLQENFVDNLGLRLAYIAYKGRVSKEADTGVTAPGLEKYTHDQLFFIAFAQTFCGSHTPAGLNHLLVNDVHSLDMFRILGTLQNSEEFSTAFSCPDDSYMNPPKKCRVLPNKTKKH